MSRAKRIPTPLPQRLADFRRSPLTAIVWVLVVTAFVMLRGRIGPPDFVGLAHSFEYNLASATTGEIESVNAVLHQNVERDQLLVHLDPTPVLARIKTAQEELARLGAELAAEKARSATELRRFLIDEEELHLKLLTLRAKLQGDRIERERLALLMSRNEELLQHNVGSESDYDDVRLQHQRTVETISENEVLLTRTKAAHASAKERREAWELQAGSEAVETTLLSPLSKAIEVQRSRLGEIHEERRALALRAPANGQVLAIHKRPGEVVLPGEPILTLADPRAGDIIVFLPEGSREALDAGSRVDVTQVSGPSAARTVVTSISPVVERMPERLWRDPVRAEYGHRVLVVRPPSLDVVPGELVRIHVVQ